MKVGGHYSLKGTVFTSEYCPGGQYSLGNSVWGDTIDRGTIFTLTPCLLPYHYLVHNQFQVDDVPDSSVKQR